MSTPPYGTTVPGNRWDLLEPYCADGQPGTAGQATPETLALLDRVAAAAGKAGAAVTPLRLPSVMDAAAQAHPVVMNMESAQALAWELDHASAQISPVLRERMDWARSQPPTALDEVGVVPTEIRTRSLDDVFVDLTRAS